MRRNAAKARIDRGEIALNGYFYLSDPAVVELMGRAGFDSATVDLEHMAWGLDRVGEFIKAAELADIGLTVRVAPGDWGTALKVLDYGATGIEVTHVKSMEIARAAVDAVKYPPVGRRGAHSISRAVAFGDLDYDEHLRTSAENTLLLLTIEDVEGVEIAGEIAALEGVDVITFGPHDLAESMGVQDAADPRVREAIEGAVEEIRAVGKARIGLPLNYPRLPLSMEDLVTMGASYTTVTPLPERIMFLGMKENIAAARAVADAARNGAAAT